MKPTILNKSIFRLIVVLFAVIPKEGLSQEFFYYSNLTTSSSLGNGPFCIQAGPTTLTAGSTLVECGANNGNPDVNASVSYQWYLNGSPIPAATSSTYSAPLNAAGTFNYYCAVTNSSANPGLASCIGTVNSPTLSIVVRALPTISLSSGAGTNNQTLCQNTGSISPNITFSIGGGATGASVAGLPAGVTGSFSAGTFTISGTPTAGAGAYNYTVSTTGMAPCAAVTATGTITVTAGPTMSLSSAAGTNNQTRCISTAITNITYATGGSATGASLTAGAFPTGVSGSWAGNVYTITGTPTVAGVFNYTITTSGGSCGALSLSGTITVLATTSASSNGGPQTLAACATSTTLTGNTPTSGIGTWTVSPAGPTFSPNANTPGATANGMVPGTNYTFTWTITNAPCASTTSSMVVTTVVGPGCLIYCTPANAADCHGTYGVIENVSFNTINNTSAGQAAYQDFTAQNTTVNIGDAVPISVSAWSTVGGGGCGSILATCLVVYVDWNADGDFNDANESTNLGPLAIAAGVQVLTGNITVPAGAISGGIMRVVLLTGAGACGDPCVPSGAGQVEDYSILITSCLMNTPNAGPDQTLAACATTASLTGNVITNGTGEWLLVSGLGTITTPSSPTSTVTNLGPGINTFQWVGTPTVQGCPTLSDEMTITTNGLPTTANAGPDLETCLTTATTAATPVTIGTGAWSIVSGSGAITAPGTSNTSGITGLVIGSPLTLLWTTTNGACTSTDQVVITMIASVTAANAGPNQTGLCSGSNINLAGNNPTNGIGTWTGAGGIIADPLSPTTAINALNTAGTYTYTWTVSAPGCASSADQVDLILTFCDPAVTTVTCPGPIVFTDPGGGNYANNEHIVQKYCPSIPGQYITAVFSQMTMGTAADHMIVLNGANYSAPIIDDFYSLPTINGGANTITSSAADGCLTFIFLSNGTTNAAGWTANISCTPTAGTGNTAQCNSTNCLGGCLRTICGIPATVPFTGDGVGAQELNSVDGGCLAAGETCSNWFLINPTNAGTLTLNMFVNSGQDQDFAVWEAYDPLLECPAMTGDAPIICNFAGSTAEGTGFNSVTEALPNPAYEPTLNISATQITAGIYYIILVNTYNNGGACPNPEVSIAFGGTAGLSCNPPIALGNDDILLAGSSDGNLNHLTWQVEEETNISSYSLERSKNGSEWSVVGVRSSGKSSDGSEYFMYDELPYTPFTYYRVKGYNTNGEIKSSNIISISKGEMGDFWVSDLFPNPTSDDVSFQYQGKNFDEPVVVVLYNSLGQIVLTETIEVNQMTGITLKTNNLANGTYQVNITQGDLKMHKKLSIVR